jgi:hypothetical protein
LADNKKLGYKIANSRIYVYLITSDGRSIGSVFIRDAIKYSNGITNVLPSIIDETGGKAFSAADAITDAAELATITEFPVLRLDQPDFIPGFCKYTHNSPIGWLITTDLPYPGTVAPYGFRLQFSANFDGSETQVFGSIVTTGSTERIANASMTIIGSDCTGVAGYYNNRLALWIMPAGSYSTYRTLLSCEIWVAERAWTKQKNGVTGVSDLAAMPNETDFSHQRVLIKKNL